MRRNLDATLLKLKFPNLDLKCDCLPSAGNKPLMEDDDARTEVCIHVAQLGAKLDLSEADVAELWRTYCRFALKSQSAGVVHGYLHNIVEEMRRMQSNVDTPMAAMGDLLALHQRVLLTVMHELQTTQLAEGQTHTIFCKYLGNVHEAMQVLLHVLLHHSNKPDFDKRLMQGFMLMKNQQKMQAEERLVFEGQLHLQFSMFNQKLQEAENNTLRVTRENEQLREQLAHFMSVMDTTCNDIRRKMSTAAREGEQQATQGM